MQTKLIKWTNYAHFWHCYIHIKAEMAPSLKSTESAERLTDFPGTGVTSFPQILVR